MVFFEDCLPACRQFRIAGRSVTPGDRFSAWPTASRSPEITIARGPVRAGDRPQEPSHIASPFERQSLTVGKPSRGRKSIPQLMSIHIIEVLARNIRVVPRPDPATLSLARTHVTSTDATRRKVSRNILVDSGRVGGKKATFTLLREFPISQTCSLQNARHLTRCAPFVSQPGRPLRATLGDRHVPSSPQLHGTRRTRLAFKLDQLGCDASSGP